MQTLLTDSPDEAAALLRRGHLVAFPTETVYGLGADATNPDAVFAIFRAKARPTDNPLIVHLAHASEIAKVAYHVSPSARALIRAFFPGPLTVVLRKRPSLLSTVTAHLGTVAVRVPAHPMASRFLSACACPVAAPSANRSGRPSATTWEAVRDDLDGRIAAILRCAPSMEGIESTVVDCSRPEPELLRAGAISLEAIRTVMPNIAVASVAPNHEVRSPGMRHRHYAPSARVVLVDTAKEAVPHPLHAYIGLERPSCTDTFGLSHHALDAPGYGHVLFSFFRQCEKAGIRAIFCQAVPETGIGRALMDRLRRAAAAPQ